MLENLHLFGHPRATEDFSKLLGLQYYFPENFRCNLTFYESDNFSNSSLHRIFESENFRFPNLGSEMWKIKLQKIVGNLLGSFENCTRMEQSRKTQVIQNFRQYLLLRTDILQKTVFGCPCHTFSVSFSAFFVAIWVAWNWHPSLIQYLTLTFGIKRCKRFLSLPYGHLCESR